MKPPRIFSAGAGAWWLVVPTRQVYGRRYDWTRHITWRDAVDACAAWYATRG